MDVILHAFGWKEVGAACLVLVVYTLLAWRWRKAALVFAMVVMLGITLFCGAYAVGYERDYDEHSHADCQGNPGPETLGAAGSPVDRGANGRPGQRRDGEQKDQDAGGDGGSIRAACEGNAIMRASLHLQAVTAGGGLAAAGMAIVAAFTSVLGYLDTGPRRRAPLCLDDSRRSDRKEERGENDRELRTRHFTIFEKVIILGLIIRGLGAAARLRR